MKVVAILLALVASISAFTSTDKIYDYLAFGERPNDRERPVHRVCLDSFYLDTHEVTQKKWKQVMGYNNSVHKGPNIAVNQIEWQEAREYCLKLGNRLPTEAEWEYAAKAGTTTVYPWGDKINRDYIWYGGNSGHTHHPVGTRKPNSWELYETTRQIVKHHEQFNKSGKHHDKSCQILRNHEKS